MMTVQENGYVQILFSGLCTRMAAACLVSSLTNKVLHFKQIESGHYAAA